MIELYKLGNADFSKLADFQLMPISCESESTLNGAWELTIEIPLDTEDVYKNLVNESVIRVPNFQKDKQLYRIYDTEKTLTTITGFARPIFFDSEDELFILDKRPTLANGQGALDSLLSGQSTYTGQSNIMTVGTFYIIRRNLMSALFNESETSFINTLGGEAYFDNYNVIINNEIGSDNGFRCELGYNMLGINARINTEEIATRIYPLSFNGYMLPEVFIDSPNIGKFQKIYHREVKFEELKLQADCTGDELGYNTLEELYVAMRLAVAEQYDNGIDLPAASYDIDFADLANTDEYKSIASLSSVGLGDYIECHNKDLGISTKARVTQIVYDNANDEVNKIYLGDYNYNIIDIISNDSDYANKLEDLTNADGTLQSEKIKGMIDLMNVSLLAQKTVAQTQDVRAILFEDVNELSPTFGALSIGTQGIQIAKTRNEDDTDWVWGTAINFEAINADYLITGMISDRAGKFSINLSTGEVIMNGIKATNADLSGKITATTGNVGGWEITDNALVSPNGTQIQSDGITNIYTYGDLGVVQQIIMGAITPNDAMINHYDFDGDGKISSIDYAMLKSQLAAL
ncbi:MAG: phage tail spike protein [Clostridia bacterium]